MPEKYKNKYRIPSARLQNWDYGTNAPYFVTICTQHRQHYFGDIVVETPESGVSNTMQLSEIGQIAQKYWNEIPQHFPFIKLGAFVVMPNHVHGIIVINKSDNERTEPTTTAKNASTSNTAAASKKWKSGTLGSIINQYKRMVTINARHIHADFAWQSRFHDHIIRNDKSFQTISEYIETNPLNWNKDKLIILNHKQTNKL